MVRVIVFFIYLFIFFFKKRDAYRKIFLSDVANFGG